LPTTPNQVIVTTGAQQAITLAAALYIQRGDTVVLENPTYFGALDVFRALGARLLPIPMDQSGLRVDALRRILETCFPRLIFLTPTFHNPTGMVLSEGRRREVARLATEFGVPLVEDNAFADLVITHEGPAPIASYAKDETIVITIGSMNKLFWQGLRIGWLRAPEVVISRLGRLKVIADLGTGFISQAIALRLMPHIDRIKAFRHQELTLQLDLLTALLQEHLPSWTWRRPDGGYFLWVRLPYGDARELAQVALRYQVVVTPGTAMSVDESYVDYLRLPFLLDAEVLRRGVERLAQAWNVYTKLAHDNNRPINVLV
jgi:DNA-binding transcriptional MocR family regulator